MRRVWPWAAAALLLLAATVAWAPRQAAVWLLADVLPRSVGRKLVQGIVRFQGFDLRELDHRFARYETAVADMAAGLYAPGGAGFRLVGDNPGPGFGTLLGYSVSSGYLQAGGAGFWAAGGYEYGDQHSERGVVYVGDAGGRFRRILGPPVAGAWFGHSVAAGGDWDGDGKADLLVGARFDRKGRGSAYVLPGGPGLLEGGDVPADAWPGHRRLVHQSSEAQAGFAVSFGDDWDGDGRDELVVRVHLQGRESGGVAVVFSSAAAPDGDIELDGPRVAQVLSGGPYLDLGRSLALGGDWDGDGKADLLMGSQTSAAYFDLQQAPPSRCYIAPSKRLQPGVRLKSADLIRIEAENPTDQLGSCVGGLGDLDGDGLDEALVGARQYGESRGAAYVLSGKRMAASWGKSVSVAEMAIGKIIGEEEGDLLGWSCAERGGDTDGDGLDEIAVGARQAVGAEPQSGAVYLLPGGQVAASGGMALWPAGKAPVLKVPGHRRGERFGSKRRFAFGTDLDGDGAADLAVGSPGWHEGGLYAGAVWIVPGESWQAGPGR